MGNAENDWQKTDPDLRAHPRFAELCELLGVPPLVADGLLSGLWRMAYRQAPDGDVTRFSARALCAGAGWDARHAAPEKVVSALRETGFLEPGGEEHELEVIAAWDEWGGAARAQRRKWAEEKARAREKVSADSGKTSSGRPPNVGKSHRAKTETLDLKVKSIREFEPDFSPWWETYGKVGSRADARLCYLHWRGEGASREDLLTAAGNYRAWCLATDTLQKHGATFLAKKPNRWEEWVNPDTAPAKPQARDKTSSDHAVACFICGKPIDPAEVLDAPFASGKGYAHRACAKAAAR
jgi:hypothetical protein